ncbi:MAG: hypothetical protein JWN86_1030 [Planctomycetota bacterium]|nr:hypothetical protein [Planctomycetota bacterium]
MSSTTKTVLLILGLLAAIFILMQLVMGQLILSGRVNLIKAHQHSGYTTVVLVIVYLVASLRAIIAVPTK